MMMRHWVMAIVLAASQTSMAASDIDCKHIEAMKTKEIEQCVETTDVALSERYQGLLKRFINMPELYNKAYNNALEQSQRSWLKYRNDECNLRTTLGYSAVDKKRMLHSCWVELTLARTKQLATF